LALVQLACCLILYRRTILGDPILLLAGGSADMNSWDPSMLKVLLSKILISIEN
jgi:hypothetical protein